MIDLQEVARGSFAGFPPLVSPAAPAITGASRASEAAALVVPEIVGCDPLSTNAEAGLPPGVVGVRRLQGVRHAHQQYARQFTHSRQLRLQPS